MQILAVDLNYEQQVSVQESSGEGHHSSCACPWLYKSRAAKFQLIILVNDLSDPSERRGPWLLLQLSFFHKQEFKNLRCSSASEVQQGWNYHDKPQEINLWECRLWWIVLLEKLILWGTFPQDVLTRGASSQPVGDCDHLWGDRAVYLLLIKKWVIILIIFNFLSAQH